MTKEHSKKRKRSVLNEKHKEWGKILLECPILVVLDESHTPRNERSRIWNTLSNSKGENASYYPELLFRTISMSSITRCIW